MINSQNKIIHRFIQPIEAYEEGGIYFNKIIPLDTQAYAYYTLDKNKLDESDYIENLKIGLFYVLGDGIHTYTELRAGKSTLPSAKEYPTFSEDWIDVINNKVDYEDLNKQYIEEIDDFSNALITNTHYVSKINLPIKIILPKTVNEAITNKILLDIKIEDLGDIIDFGTNHFIGSLNTVYLGISKIEYTYNNLLNAWVCEIKPID